MPRYRVTKPLPDVLVYRGGVKVWIQRATSPYLVESLQAKKDEPRSGIVVLCRGGTIPLDELLATGFDVDGGSSAERIMSGLVAKGYAELVK